MKLNCQNDERTTWMFFQPKIKSKTSEINWEKVDEKKKYKFQNIFIEIIMNKKIFIAIDKRAKNYKIHKQIKLKLVISWFYSRRGKIYFKLKINKI